MSRVTATLLITFALLSAPAQAADDRYGVAGAGAASCGKWIEARKADNQSTNLMLTSWLQGFLSGMNTQRSLLTNQEYLLIPDSPTLLAYVDKACRDNPLSNVYVVAIRLYQEMQKP